MQNPVKEYPFLYAYIVLWDLNQFRQILLVLINTKLSIMNEFITFLKEDLLYYFLIFQFLSELKLNPYHPCNIQNRFKSINLLPGGGEGVKVQKFNFRLGLKPNINSPGSRKWARTHL